MEQFDALVIALEASTVVMDNISNDGVHNRSIGTRDGTVSGDTPVLTTTQLVQLIRGLQDLQTKQIHRLQQAMTTSSVTLPVIATEHPQPTEEPEHSPTSVVDQGVGDILDRLLDVEKLVEDVWKQDLNENVTRPTTQENNKSASKSEFRSVDTKPSSTTDSASVVLEREIQQSPVTDEMSSPLHKHREDADSQKNQNLSKQELTDDDILEELLKDDQNLGSGQSKPLRRSPSDEKLLEKLLVDKSTKDGAMGTPLSCFTTAVEMQEIEGDKDEVDDEAEVEEEEEEEELEEEESEDSQTRLDGDSFDDSALYCPTIKANVQHAPASTKTRSMLQTDANLVAAATPRRPRITHIEVGNLVSPAPTVLTMDSFTAFDHDNDDGDTLADNSKVLDESHDPEATCDDNDSVNSDETPVLDRYRIDVDDKSPFGFRVVPNQRGSRKRQDLGSKPPSKPKVTRWKALPRTEASPHHGKNHRTIKSFRKTPYFKRSSPLVPTIDENAPLNEADDNNQNASPLMKDVSKLNFERGIRQTDENHNISNTDHVSSLVALERQDPSLPPSLIYAKAELASPKPRRRAQGSDPPMSTLFQRHTGALIQPIDESEYESAPRVVKMQVALCDIQQATRALNDAMAELWSSSGHSLSESQAKRVLKPLGFEDSKSRKILMSLCHFRRLVMRRRHSIAATSDAKSSSLPMQENGASLVFELPPSRELW